MSFKLPVVAIAPWYMTFLTVSCVLAMCAEFYHHKPGVVAYVLTAFGVYGILKRMPLSSFCREYICWTALIIAVGIVLDGNFAGFLMLPAFVLCSWIATDQVIDMPVLWLTIVIMAFVRVGFGAWQGEAWNEPHVDVVSLHDGSDQEAAPAIAAEASPTDMLTHSTSVEDSQMVSSPSTPSTAH